MNNSYQGKFRSFFEEGLSLLERKGNDYSEEEDRFSNFRVSEKVKVPAHVGAFIRLGDKYSRLTQLFGNKESMVKEESIEDTLIDLANYANIVYQLYKEFLKKLDLKDGLERDS